MNRKNPENDSDKIKVFKHSLIEIFEIENHVIALYHNEFIHFRKLPDFIKLPFLLEMEAQPTLQRHFDIHKINDLDRRLEKYICIIYGSFNDCLSYSEN